MVDFILKCDDYKNDNEKQASDIFVDLADFKRDLFIEYKPPLRPNIILPIEPKMCRDFQEQEKFFLRRKGIVTT